MKHLTAIILAIVATMSAYADIKDDRVSQIRSNDNYISGDGYGSSYDEAKSQALNDLISKISVSLTTHSELHQSSGNENGQTTYTSNLNSTVSMYSQATLTNTHSEVLSEAPQFHVFCYMGRDELAKIYDIRQQKLEIYVTEGLRALDNGQIDTALSYLYWALSLVKSLQYPDKSTYNHRGQNVHLTIWLPEQIEQIIDRMTVGVTNYNKNENTADLYFKYDGKQIRSVEFEYWDGMQYSIRQKARDGIAQIALRPGTSPRDVRIRYIYNCNPQSQGKEVENIVSLFGELTLGVADVSLASVEDSSSSIVSKEAKKEMEIAIAENNNIGIEPLKDYKEYDKSIQKVMKAIKTKKFEEIKPLFTSDGWDMMDKLLHYGNATVFADQKYSMYTLHDGRVTCRSITMSFAFPNNHMTFTEDVVFTFDNEKRIEGVTFGLGARAKDDIFSIGQSAQWTDASMMAIVDFLENYKTAFALKRTDYIESIFDDYAIIVTGHVVKRSASVSERMPKLSSDIIKYTKYSKDEYIKRLRDIFSRNEYVNIQFSDNDVQRMLEGDQTFAIQIHQDYYSSHYGDTGYLFLIVDVNEPQQPVIKVRMWQPERNPDLHPQLPKTSPDYGIVTAGDF